MVIGTGPVSNTPAVSGLGTQSFARKKNNVLQLWFVKKYIICWFFGNVPAIMAFNEVLLIYVAKKWWEWELIVGASIVRNLIRRLAVLPPLIANLSHTIAWPAVTCRRRLRRLLTLRGKQWKLPCWFCKLIIQELEISYPDEVIGSLFLRI